MVPKSVYQYDDRCFIYININRYIQIYIYIKSDLSSPSTDVEETLLLGTHRDALQRVYAGHYQ